MVIVLWQYIIESCIFMALKNYASLAGDVRVVITLVLLKQGIGLHIQVASNFTFYSILHFSHIHEDYN